MRLWGDIADKEWFRTHAARAPKSIDLKTITRDEIVCFKAKEIFDGIADGSDESRFLTLARSFAVTGSPEAQYSSIHEMAMLFNLDFENLRDWLKWKGLIGFTRKPAEKT